MKRVIKAGTELVLSPVLFDAMNAAGLIALWGTDGRGDNQWPVWGETLDNGDVRCRLKDENGLRNQFNKLYDAKVR